MASGCTLAQYERSGAWLAKSAMPRCPKHSTAAIRCVCGWTDWGRIERPAAQQKEPGCRPSKFGPGQGPGPRSVCAATGWRAKKLDGDWARGRCGCSDVANGLPRAAIRRLPACLACSHWRRSSVTRDHGGPAVGPGIACKHDCLGRSAEGGRRFRDEQRLGGAPLVPNSWGTARNSTTRRPASTADASSPMECSRVPGQVGKAAECSC
ncbi:hypothetical protein CDD83_2042 [Cordyceps sp. RAO-2017]|nr:hypothetical protein CDD83_2042 [Cordyceps sp. RAO-2017]